MQVRHIRMLLQRKIKVATENTEEISKIDVFIWKEELIRSTLQISGYQTKLARGYV